jgi:hypothetical protein
MIVAQHVKCWVRRREKRRSPGKGRLKSLLNFSRATMAGLRASAPDVSPLVSPKSITSVKNFKLRTLG